MLFVNVDLTDSGASLFAPAGEHACLRGERVRQCGGGTEQGEASQVYRGGAGVFPPLVGLRGHQGAQETGAAAPRSLHLKKDRITVPLLTVL